MVRRGLRLPLAGATSVARVGVEQEHRVFDDEQAVDFRRLLPLIASQLRSLDPGDPRARRLPSDVVLTADGWEAELSSPPLPATRAGMSRVVELLGQERGRLLTELGTVLSHPRMEGFSTHLNVSVPDHAVVAVGRAFARHCVPAVADVTEGPGSLGILVRPRRGRLEICCDHVDGARLDEALQVARACVVGLTAGDLPPISCAEPEPAREKYGWFLPPDALRSSPALSAWVSTHRTRLEEGCGAPDHVDASVRRFDEFTAETEWVTWEWVCWVIAHQPTDGAVYAVLSSRQERQFLDLLDRGELTPLIRRALTERRRRRLWVNRQIGSAALWHDVRPGALVPAERDLRGQVPRVRIGQVRKEARTAATQLEAGSRRPPVLHPSA